VTVPSGATTGNVVVTAAGGVASNGVSFTVKAPYSFSVTYAPDGAILAANDSVNGNWTYTYDDFARLSTANNSAPTQGFSYVYDQYGNRWQQNLTAGSGGVSNLTFSNNASAATYGTNNQCYHAAGVTNQPDGYCYDAAGNLLNDGTHSYAYDAENRIISVDGGQTATYTYNASGQRSRKVSSAGTVDYLYDLAGHQITELNGTGGWNRGEVYSGGRHVATYNNGTTYFVQSDWQGTERTRTTLSGAQCETTTNLPFGDGQSMVTNCPGDPSPNHFTGKQRDTESNLDYFGARYYSSSMGRFVTPDWDGKPVAVPYAKFGDPQSLNLYAYTLNNPISGIDPDGHAPYEYMLAVQGGWGVDTMMSNGAGETTDSSTLSDDELPPPQIPTPKPPDFAFDQAKINTLTVSQVAGIVFNENRDVFPGDSTPQQLQEAKTAQAHAIINGDRKRGKDRPQTAPWRVSKAQQKSVQYQQALTAARTAYLEDGIGKDPTGGRIHYNNRFEPQKDHLNDPRKGDNHLVQDVFHVYGSFTVGGGKVWTIIYDDYRKE